MKGAIFDLDGVITDTAKFHFAAWSQLASEKLGLKLPASFETELKGISRIESLERILDFGGLRDKYTAEQVEELAAEKNGYYLKAIDTLTKDDILPGITRLIGELKEHDVKLSVASASKNAPVILKNWACLTNLTRLQILRRSNMASLRRISSWLVLVLFRWTRKIVSALRTQLPELTQSRRQT